ncbi:unnamed protein product [Cuscuta epithymum]|uniref:1-phosphatidylinositol 4-kinase n=1 Tax=Cuscuta epithymum TaxID=186058 RepID=A0AAV0DYH8_9ASTE|nr:unnamed protein product [Cuscuta epithymum]CAH9131199.1 unnamed protein product [Cuscuta epithymum]
MAMAIFRSPLGREYRGNKSSSQGKPAGRRRVFVQTETGCVVGMELDRNDNAHTVKRRLQIALNVPTDESSLTFGDLVLKNDLTAIRKDSALLFTRNHLHRSSSSPCLSPSPSETEIHLRADQTGRPIEILGQSSSSFALTEQLVNETVEGMKAGIDPLRVSGGLGGAYYFRNSRGDSVAIVKPTDEEPYAPNNPKGFVGKTLGQPGLKRSVRVGETGFREVAAYLLDHHHFANVPPTALVKITHSIFNVNDSVNGSKKSLPVTKIASFQQFISHDFDASDYGTSGFPVSSVHRVGILDIRIFNTDRHGGNLLVRKHGQFGQVELIPIDHGLCLPETLEDPYFEWIHWPQSSIPFSDEELDYINKLDPVRDSEMLRRELPMIREACLRVLVLCTVFLKEAATYGLCLAEIGEMMSREFHGGDEAPSELEIMCMEASKLVVAEKVEDIVSDDESNSFQFDLDFDDGAGGECEATPFGFAFKGREEMQEGSRKSNIKLHRNLLGSSETERGHVITSCTGHRSADEEIRRSVGFVKLGDMKEEVWAMFLEKFLEVAHPAFAKRRSVTLGQKQLHRLGSSCQF